MQQIDIERKEITIASLWAMIKGARTHVVLSVTIQLHAKEYTFTDRLTLILQWFWLQESFLV